jgi:hypothetical protein
VSPGSIFDIFLLQRLPPNQLHSVLHPTYEIFHLHLVVVVSIFADALLEYNCDSLPASRALPHFDVEAYINVANTVLWDEHLAPRRVGGRVNVFGFCCEVLGTAEAQTQHLVLGHPIFAAIVGWVMDNMRVDKVEEILDSDQKWVPW